MANLMRHPPMPPFPYNGRPPRPPELAPLHSEMGAVLKGERGESAYEVAVANGFQGDESAWLATLKADATRAAELTEEAKGYRNQASESAANAATHAVKAKEYSDDIYRIREQISPETESALSQIRAAQTGAQTYVDQAATQASLAKTSALQADADATEVRWLLQRTTEEKNVATDAAERARKYAVKGEDGASAYDIAVAHGYVGTIGEWLASLKGNTGATGDSAYDIAVSAGFDGTKTDWLLSLKGKDGINGAKGDKGDKGDTGESAYDVAVANGFIGTKDEWYNSMKGEKGDPGGPFSYRAATHAEIDSIFGAGGSSSVNIDGEDYRVADNSDIDGIFTG